MCVPCYLTADAEVAAAHSKALEDRKAAAAQAAGFAHSGGGGLLSAMRGNSQGHTK